MHPRYFVKLFYAALPRFSLYRRGFSGFSQLAFVFLVIFGVYTTMTSYYTFRIDKSSPIIEVFNETVYTETPISLNTEATSVVMRKQQTNLLPDRPALGNETLTAFRAIQIQEVLPNCGLPSPCEQDQFSVHLYTGKDNTDEPRLCVDGKYILSKDVNGGGRGVNVAVIDNLTRTIIRVGHYDTYEKESVVLETLLLTLRPGDILILLTFDEPSRKLSRFAKLLLYDLGSAFVQNLGYRGSWYLVTQKGLSGFSPFEELHLIENNGWPKHHDVRFCVPFEIKGTVVHPDPPSSRNPARVQFCQQNDDLPFFCDADVVNDILEPAPAWKQPAAVNRIYNVPILVMSGDNPQFLPLTLETLVRQPGIKPSLVMVFHLPHNKMVQNLSNLFGFLHEELSETLNYCERLEEAFDIMSLLYPEAKETIVISENAILAPDFLFYLGQLYSIFTSDSSLLSVSALNENGFKGLSGDPAKVYRVETFSSLGILVKRDFMPHIWCGNQSLIDPFYISSRIKGMSLVPDVSRITLAAPMSSSDENQDVSSIFLSHDRTVTYEQNIALRNVEKLLIEDYSSEIEALLKSSFFLKFDKESLSLCLKDTEKFQKKLDHFPLFISSSSISNKVISIYIHQNSIEDLSSFGYLTKCLGLFHHPLYPVRGIYKGMLRFMLKDHSVFLVGSKSPFFVAKSQKIELLQYDSKLHRLVYIAS